jgi:hypothetical protein
MNLVFIQVVLGRDSRQDSDLPHRASSPECGFGNTASAIGGLDQPSAVDDRYASSHESHRGQGGKHSSAVRSHYGGERFGNIGFIERLTDAHSIVEQRFIKW